MWLPDNGGDKKADSPTGHGTKAILPSDCWVVGEWSGVHPPPTRVERLCGILLQ